MSMVYHEYNIFKKAEAISCIPIAIFGARLGSRIGSISNIDALISSREGISIIWNKFILENRSRDALCLAFFLFMSLILDIFSEVRHSPTNCREQVSYHMPNHF